MSDRATETASGESQVPLIDPAALIARLDAEYDTLMQQKYAAEANRDYLGTIGPHHQAQGIWTALRIIKQELKN